MKSIVKDYLTGKEYVEIKHKPDLPIKGRASVYLYNARTGKLELEAHTPNIIYPEVYAWLRSYQWDKFCSGAPNKTNSYGGYWEMDNIFLSSSSKPETERVNAFTYNASNTSNGNPGIQIGWANKSTYSGGDTQRGTPNTAESYANNSRVHWVFDWPTHAANGTFQTIIWGKQFAPYGSSTLICSLGIQSNTHAELGLTYANGYLYALTYDGKLYKLSLNGEVQGQPISTGISVFDGSAIGLEYDGSCLCALTRDGNLYKISLNGEVQGLPADVGIKAGKYDYSGFDLASDGNILYGINCTGNLYKINVADHYFARTRLAAPVTKTNQQTMKIQYDFIYEE